MSSTKAMQQRAATNRRQQNRCNKLEVSVNLKPSEKQIQQIEDLQTSVDAMILNDAFIGQNLMRKEENSCLFWDWAIVKVGNFTFPTPIHTMSETESLLYTFNGRDVVLSNEECAYTTAYFYIDVLQSFANEWSTVQHKLHSFHSVCLYPAIKLFSSMNAKNVADIKMALHSKLSDKGFSVLN